LAAVLILSASTWLSTTIYPLMLTRTFIVSAVLVVSVPRVSVFRLSAVRLMKVSSKKLRIVSKRLCLLIQKVVSTQAPTWHLKELPGNSLGALGLRKTGFRSFFQGYVFSVFVYVTTAMSYTGLGGKNEA
jgi:hypothetical protein